MDSATAIRGEATLVVDGAAEGLDPSEIVGYIEYCRQRVRDVLAGMAEEMGATPLPPAHRSCGQPHAWIITAAAGHAIEHGSQIRQFVTDRTSASGL